MRIAVINSSPTAYNFATAKMVSKFQAEGHEVFFSNRADLWSMDCQKAYLSAIFTWDLPLLLNNAQLLASRGIEVEVGGPAVTAMPEYITNPGDYKVDSVTETLIPEILNDPDYRNKTPDRVWRRWISSKIKVHVGLDERFEHVPGSYQVTFTSRGCPRACEFCLVSRLEGRKIVEYEDFVIPSGNNPYVCDNNLLCTSWEHQKMVVDKLRGVSNLDINSGFDDRIFARDPDKYWALYRQLKLECWRFAYDSADQREHIDFIAKWLGDRGVDYRHIIVFCLAGGPGMSFSECKQRLQHLIDIKCSPYPMRYRPLDSLENAYTPPGWRDKWLEILFSYYGVPFIWRSCSWQDHLHRKHEEGKLTKLELEELL